MKAFLAILVVLGLIASGAFFFDRDEGRGQISYVTAPVERGKVALHVTAIGRVRAVVMIDVNAQISGQITKIHADFNETVEKGQLLARIDRSSYRASFDEAQAAVMAAESGILIQEARLSEARGGVASERASQAIASANFERAKTSLHTAEEELARLKALRTSGAVSGQVFEKVRTNRDLALLDVREAEGEAAVHQQTIIRAEANSRRAEAELDNARATLAQMQSSRERAEIQLERTEIRAPIGGIVIDRGVEVGQTVSAAQDGRPLFRIAKNLAEIEVHAKIDEADIGRIRIDQAAEFQVDAFPGRTFGATVTQVRRSPQITNNVVTYTVVLTASNPDLHLLPGMTSLVRIAVEETDADVLVIPSVALRVRLEPLGPEAELATSEFSNVVWVQDDVGAIEPVKVELGLTSSSQVEIRPGAIDEGQQVIVAVKSDERPRRLFGLRIGF